MAAKRVSKAKRSRPPAKKKPTTKRPRKVALQGRIATSVRALGTLSANTPLALKAATGGATAGTTPMNAASSVIIEPPPGGLQIKGAVAMAEGADAVDAVGAVVTKPRAVEALDVIDAALEQAGSLARVFDTLRADRTYNGASELPVLTEWHVTVAFKATQILRAHANGDEQSAPVLDFALSVLKFVGGIVVSTFKWFANLGTLTLAGYLSLALFTWTPEQWTEHAVRLEHALASLPQMFGFG